MLHDAFISYSHKDCGKIAPAIQKGIQSVGRPWYQLSRNLQVYRDQTNLKASPHLWSEIELALNNSKHFILFASPDSASSKWVKRETEVWIKNNYSEELGLIKIFIVLTEGNIEWHDENNDFDWHKTNCLPEGAFSNKFKECPKWIDLTPYVRKTNEGSNIDFKAAGFTQAMTTIIGGILDIDPWKIESDELKSQKIIKNIVITSFVLLLILLATIGFLYRNAVIQKKEADSQRDSAQFHLRNFKIKQFERNLNNAEILSRGDEDSLAYQEYLKADSIIKLYPLDLTIYSKKDVVTKNLSILNNKLKIK